MSPEGEGDAATAIAASPTEAPFIRLMPIEMTCPCCGGAMTATYPLCEAGAGVAHWGSSSVRLTITQMRIVRYLISAAPRRVPIDELAMAVYSDHPTHQFKYKQTLRVLISQIRIRMEQDIAWTITYDAGLGYTLMPVNGGRPWPTL